MNLGSLFELRFSYGHGKFEFFIGWFWIGLIVLLIWSPWA